MPCSLSHLFTLVLLSSPNNEELSTKLSSTLLRTGRAANTVENPQKDTTVSILKSSRVGSLLCMGNPCVGQKVAGPWGWVTAVFFGPQGFQAALPIFWLLFQSPIATLVTHRPQESSVLIYINHST